MKCFKDGKGQTWDIVLNVSQLKNIKSILGFDILAEDENKILSLYNDIMMFCDVLFVICKKQANERNITDEKFGELLVGDVISLAIDAFMEELSDFFPNPRRREILKKFLADMKGLESLSLERANQDLSGVVDQAKKDLSIGGQK